MISLIFLLLYGCAGAGDYVVSLPGGYSLLRGSAHMITINKNIDENIWSEAVIPAKITKLAWNEKYILAKQLGLKRQYPNDPNNTYEIPDESKVSYWILEVVEGKIYGPLTEDEFIKEKKELSIPDNIILKKVSSYNKN